MAAAEKRTGLVRYEFTAKLWQTEGKCAWHFASLPAALTKEIRERMKSEEEGWGRLKITAETGKSEWATAIWFDTKQNTYLLPIKAQIRRNEKIETDQDIKIALWI